MFVELEGESFQEGDVVGEHLLVREVQFQYNDGVDVVVREKVVYATDNKYSLYKVTGKKSLYVTAYV